MGEVVLLEECRAVPRIETLREFGEELRMTDRAVEIDE
jgi:hypothetical protein